MYFVLSRNILSFVRKIAFQLSQKTVDIYKSSQISPNNAYVTAMYSISVVNNALSYVK